MIKIIKSNKADTRTCDVSKVTKEEFERDIYSHIKDVKLGMGFFMSKMNEAGMKHDYTKISELDWFYNDFKTKFKKCDWYKMHQREERHHLHDAEYIQDDVNLIDIFEMITDNVMAGMARSGKYRHIDISEQLLVKAYENTVDLLLKNVKVVDNDTE